jgi:hypothetical protein
MSMVTDDERDGKKHPGVKWWETHIENSHCTHIFKMSVKRKIDRLIRDGEGDEWERRMVPLLAPSHRKRVLQKERKMFEEMEKKTIRLVARQKNREKRLLRLNKKKQLDDDKNEKENEPDDED